VSPNQSRQVRSTPSHQNHRRHHRRSGRSASGGDRLLVATQLWLTAAGMPEARRRVPRKGRRRRCRHQYGRRTGADALSGRLPSPTHVGLCSGEQHLLHLGPRVRLNTLERYRVRFHHALEDRRIGRRPLTDPFPPSCDVGSPVPHPGEPKQLQPSGIVSVSWSTRTKPGLPPRWEMSTPSAPPEVASRRSLPSDRRRRLIKLFRWSRLLRTIGRIGG